MRVQREKGGIHTENVAGDIPQFKVIKIQVFCLGLSQFLAYTVNYHYGFLTTCPWFYHCCQVWSAYPHSIGLIPKERLAGQGTEPEDSKLDMGMGCSFLFAFFLDSGCVWQFWEQVYINSYFSPINTLYRVVFNYKVWCFIFFGSVCDHTPPKKNKSNQATIFGKRDGALSGIAVISGQERNHVMRQTRGWKQGVIHNVAMLPRNQMWKPDTATWLPWWFACRVLFCVFCWTAGQPIKYLY